MGNRSRRSGDGGSAPGASRSTQSPPTGNTNDPLYGIPDTNVPGLAGIRMARALQGRRGWRRWFAIAWLASLVLGAIAMPLIRLLRHGV